MSTVILAPLCWGAVVLFLDPNAASTPISLQKVVLLAALAVLVVVPLKIAHAASRWSGR